MYLDDDEGIPVHGDLPLGSPMSPSESSTQGDADMEPSYHQTDPTDDAHSSEGDSGSLIENADGLAPGAPMSSSASETGSDSDEEVAANEAKVRHLSSLGTRL